VSTLAAAVASGHEERIDALLSAAVEPDRLIKARHPDFQTALVLAARHASTTCTFKLLDLGADPHLFGANSPWGSALHAAAQAGDAHIVTRLLDLGMSPDLTGGRYGMPLQAACRPLDSNPNLSVLRLLLDKGAAVNAVGGRYGTALQCAAKHGLLDAVRLLVERGVDLTITGGRYGTAMKAAEALEQWHVYNFLQRHCRKHDISAGNA
jgi:ankyrin repeat protein